MEQRTAIVAIAAAEVGYREGPGNQSKYGAWYGLPNDPWCAMFLSWCANQAGVGQDIIPKFAYVPDGVRFFRQQGRWRGPLSGYVPQPGDVIFYGSGGSTGAHVGLVERVSGNYVVALEGNTGSGGEVSEGEGVYRRTRALRNSWIMGYGLPAYLEEEDEMRYNKLSEIPDWAKDAVERRLQEDVLQGEDQGLDLSRDMLRMMVIWDREAALKQKE